MRSIMICVSIVFACASSVSASLNAFWQHNPITPAAIADTPVLADMQSWSLMVTYTDGDWASAGLRATLPAGHTYFHHPLGGNTRPSPIFVQLFPGLAYDSYVTGPSDPPAAPVILGGHPASPNADFGGTTGIFSVSWGDLVTSPTGTFEIARLTFPLGVIPTVYWEGQPPMLPNSSHTSTVSPDFTVIIPQIPEPALLNLLVIPGILLLRSRRT